jgi:PKD repeat protein
LDYYTAAVTLVLPPPVANFSSSLTNGIVPLAVTFTNLSTGTGLTNWFWTFGDGITATNATGFNVIHTYTNAGTYNVSLTVNGQSGAGTNTKSGYVTALAPAVANFAASPTNGVAPLTVTFTNLTTGTGLTNFLWTFGDGAILTNSTGINVVHTYTNAGIYTISVAVNGQSGASTYAATNAIQVLPCIVTIVLQPTSRAAVVGSTVTFSANAIATGSRTNYQWFFQSNPIAGRTNATLVLNNLQTTNFGTYSVVADNGICSTVSSNALLTQAISPTIAAAGLNGTTLLISVPTEIGPDYFVEFKNNLGDLTWSPLITLVGNGSPQIVTNSMTNSTRRFYHVRVQ